MPLLHQLQTAFTADCILLTVITWLQRLFADIPYFRFTKYPPPHAARATITGIALVMTVVIFFSGDINTLTTALAWFGGIYIAFHLLRRAASRTTRTYTLRKMER